MIRKLKRSAVLVSAVLAGAAVALFAGLALARASHTTLGTAHSSALGKTVVVDPKNGHTLYHLQPETIHNLICKSKACLSTWPPMKVSKNQKLTKAAGIKGKLGRFHRNGFWQLTLGGAPLYHFSGDLHKGDANGEGIPDPPGTWHAQTAAKAKTTTTSTSTGTSTTTTSTSSTKSCAYPPYCY